MIRIVYYITLFYSNRGIIQDHSSLDYSCLIAPSCLKFLSSVCFRNNSTSPNWEQVLSNGGASVMSFVHYKKENKTKYLLVWVFVEQSGREYKMGDPFSKVNCALIRSNFTIVQFKLSCYVGSFATFLFNHYRIIFHFKK